MTCGWSPRALLHEAFANVVARPWSALSAAVLIVGMCVAASTFELVQADVAVSSMNQLVAQGYTTVKVSSARAGQVIPAAPCATLVGRPGVVAAGGVGQPTIVQTTSDPGDGFTEAPAVGSVVAALTGQGDDVPSRRGVVVSSELASELGVVAGSHLDIGRVSVPVAEVAPLGQRDQFLGRVVLEPTAAIRSLTACYVQFAPGDFSTGVGVLSALYAGVPNVQMEPLVPHGLGTADPAAAFATRPSRYAWLVGGALLGMLLLVLRRNRRHELAVYLLTGTRRVEVGLLTIAEIGIVLWPAAVSAILWTATVAVIDHAPWAAFRLATLSAVETALVGACGAPLGLLWLLRTDLTAALRQRAS